MHEMTQLRSIQFTVKTTDGDGLVLKTVLTLYDLRYSMCFPLFLSQPSVLIVSYIESVKAATRFGCYQQSEWKPDDSMIAVVVSKVETFFFCCFTVVFHLSSSSGSVS